ncbi:MAG TPA: ABC transporter permease [Candidatus Competibacter sp.]|nr:ABC transporter permease [Candidatus Competibacter sp.]
MSKSLANIYRLGIKELLSLRADLVMVLLIVYVFTVAIYSVATGASTEVANAAVAIIDEDRSPLSQRIQDALLQPYFQPPAQLAVSDLDSAMDAGRYTFVIDVPPNFQADVRAGRQPAIQINVDATAMSQAGMGASYLQNIIAQEILAFAQGREGESQLAVNLVVRAWFNPNLKSSWFLAVMQLINNITLLAIILTGAALIREREHGTIEHLLVMPLRPAEIMLAKIWANGLVIVVAGVLSLYLVVQGWLQVPIAGSIPLFVAGTVIYLFSVTALGIFLATLTRSMPQFGLLAIPVFMVMNLLSGGTTPLDSMPKPLQAIMQLAPSTHFVSFAQAILYRGAGFAVVWPNFAAVAASGMIFFGIALLRFRRMVTLMQQ